MNPLQLMPLWGRVLAIGLFALSLVGFGYVKGINHESTKNLKAQLGTLEAQRKAVVERVAANAVLKAKQEADNKDITRRKDEEIDKLRADKFFAERMRYPNFCAGFTTGTEARGPEGSNGTDTGSGLVPKRVEEDIQKLIMKTEEVAATGRACQLFLSKNGFSQ